MATFFNSHMQKKAYTMKDIPDPSTEANGVLLKDIFPVNLNEPVRGINQAIDHLERGGFAASGRTKEDKGLSALYLEREISYGVGAAPVNVFEILRRRIT